MLNKINKYSGVVAVVYIEKDPIKFAIVKTKRGCSLPGGGIEKNDTSLESAMYRELEEELGLKSDNIILTKTDLEETFKYDSDKTARANQPTVRPVYLIKSLKENLIPNDNEVINSNWYSYKEAMNILTWENAKDILEKIVLSYRL